MSTPPNMQENDRVILFDGVCKLCNAWSNFIIRHDSEYHFKLCSVQSVEGQKILAHFDFPTDHFETMLYVEGNVSYQKSDAFFRVVRILGFPWSLSCIFQILPVRLRDWLYDRIALNRYTLFGRYDFCRLPAADHEQRYVSEK
jgi:predicted DCC family thiol-disulfide oxidoreductase YuxK